MKGEIVCCELVIAVVDTNGLPSAFDVFRLMTPTAAPNHRVPVKTEAASPRSRASAVTKRGLFFLPAPFGAPLSCGRVFGVSNVTMREKH